MMNKNIDLFIEIEPQVNIDLELSIDQVAGEHGYYHGEYRVIPKFNEQVLETNDKIMQDDVTVEEIPVYKTENLGGGYTVVIGGN